MPTKSVVLAAAAAAVLLPGFMVMPAIAADPLNLVPEDASTPTAPAHDIDDTRVTAQIRSALISDKSLSMQAHHLTIATNSQAVVLRGSVRSDEKDRIEALAQQFAGTRQVVNQLLVQDM
jgi:hypothetical protein